MVVFNQSLPSNVDFAIKFVGLRTSEETVCSAQKIGDNVLTFTAPGILSILVIFSRIYSDNNFFRVDK